MQLKQTILVLGEPRTLDKELKRLEQDGLYAVVQEPWPATRAELVENMKALSKQWSVEAILLLHGQPFKPLDEEIFSPFVPALQIVCGIAAGFDHVDTEYLELNGVWYTNTPMAVAEPTATTAVMLILQTIRASTAADHAVRQGTWRGDLKVTPNTRGLIVGIIGMGTIGKLVSQKVQALGMKVIYHNRRPLPREEEGGATYVPFDELLARSRLITLHCPLTRETTHLLSDQEFSKMQDGVFIVNTSRGPVIDEEALVRAMKSSKVLRAGLDVFEHEPMVHPWLLGSHRVSLLPHWGAATETIYHDMEHESFANLLQWIETGVPNTPVNHPCPRL